MAENVGNNGVAEILSRQSGSMTSSVASEGANVTLSESSVIKIQGSPEMVMNYERQGNDLIIHMKDGSTTRYKNFFSVDEEGRHSELVFDDGVTIQHAVFPFATDVASPVEAIAISPQFETIADISALTTENTSSINTFLLGVLGFLAIGGGVAALASSHSGSGSHKNGANNDNNPGGNTDNLPPTLTVNPLSDDNILNTSEVKAGQRFSGSTTNVEAGQIVTVVLNDKTYLGVVGADGKWQVTIPAADFLLMQDGSYSLTVTTSDKAGHIVDKTVNITIDTTAPDITLDAFTGDNFIDAVEVKSSQTVSGSVSVSETGQTVTVQLNGKSYTTIAGSDGKWSLSVPTADLQAMADGAYSLTVSVRDVAGQSASLTHQITVDATTPLIKIDPIGADNYLNQQEAQAPLTIGGSSAHVSAGETVTVTLNGKTYTTTINGDGSWKVSISSNDLNLIADGPYNIVATVPDGKGNTLTGVLPIDVDLTPPTLMLNDFATDNILGAGELNSVQSLSGSASVTEAGQNVIIVLNGKNYTTKVQTDGSWNLNIPAADLKLLSDGIADIKVSLKDLAGNIVSETLSLDVIINNLPNVSVNSPFGGSKLNAIEAALDQAISGSTGVSGAGQSVLVSFNNQTYQATVDNSGNWSLSIPSADLIQIQDGSTNLTVTATDRAGNKSVLTESIGIYINHLPSATLNTPFGTGFLNAEESQSSQTLSGTTGVSGSGQSVIVKIDGNSYTANVANDGSWTLVLTTDQLGALSTGPLTVVVTVSDAANNQQTIQSGIVVDRDIPVLTVDQISGDGVINSLEILNPVEIKGSASVGDAGQQVKVTIGGITYSGMVQGDGSWTITLPSGSLNGIQDGKLSLDLSLTDQAGNTGHSIKNVIIDADPANLPTLTINTISDDNYINQKESGQSLEISGTTKNVEIGQLVTVNINGQIHTASVGSDGNWSFTIDASEVGALSDGQGTITAKVTDKAGNPANSAHTITVIADAADLPVIHINAVSDNDRVNSDEKNGPLIISGTTQNIDVNTLVTIKFNGQSYTTKVDSDGNWRYELDADTVNGLSDKQYTVEASVDDAAQNQATASHTFTVDSKLPLLTVDLFASDNILNLAEATLGQSLTGQTDAGLKVTLTINNIDYSATADIDGYWRIQLSSSVLLGLAEETNTFTLKVTDGAGNTTTKTVDVTVATHILPGLTVDTIFQDGLLSLNDTTLDNLITGTYTNLPANAKITVTIGDSVFEGSVDSNGHWSVTVPANSLNVLNLVQDGQLQIGITAADDAGNKASTSGSLDVYIHNLPNPSINLPFGDGDLNAKEALVDQLITGSTGVKGGGQTVIVSIDGKDYNADVSVNGSWTVTIPKEDLALLVDKTHNLSVEVTDKAGNTGTIELDFDSIIHLTPLPTIVRPFDDGKLSIDESQLASSLSGTTGATGAGQTVTVSINGTNYPGVTVDDQGNWTMPLTIDQLGALPDGTLPITVTVTDKVGNTNSTSIDLGVYTHTMPAPTVNTPFLDGILNHQEALNGQLLTGKTGLIGADQTVTVSIDGGPAQQAIVNASGQWQLALTDDFLTGLDAGPHTISVTASDAANNHATGADVSFTSSQTLPTPGFTELFGNDGYLSLSDASNAMLISGTTGVTSGSSVATLMIDLNGVQYPAMVNGNTWTVNIPANALNGLVDQLHTITITVTDDAGNTNTYSEDFTSLIHNVPKPVIETIFGDGYLNQAEAGLDQTITGNTGATGAQQQVTVTLNNKPYTVTAGTDGHWVVTVPSADLLMLQDGTPAVTVKVQDVAGNTATSSGSVVVVIDSADLPTITIDNFAGDNILTTAESHQLQTISGTTTNIAVGQPVTITLNGKSYSAKVGGDGKWSVNVPVADATALTANGAGTNIHAQVSDNAGNLATGDHSFTVDTSLPPPIITIDPVTGDNVVIADEVNLLMTIGGKAPFAIGQLVNVTIQYDGVAVPYVTSTLVNPDGTWDVAFIGNLAFLQNGNYTVTASTAGLGGTGTAEVNVLVDTQLPALTVNQFAGDDRLSHAEAGIAQSLSGSTTADEAGHTVTIKLNGKTYYAVVDQDGNWSTRIPSADLQALTQGPNSAEVTLIDDHGNKQIIDHSFVVNSDLPLLSIDVIATDNILTLVETLLGLVIGGNGEIGAQINVTVGSLISTTVTVDGTGHWSLNLSHSDLLKLADGPLSISASVTDSDGNANSVNATLNVALNQALDLVLDPVFGGGGLLNQLESEITQVLSGTVLGNSVGAVVKLTLNGEIFSATVGAGGKWSINIEPGFLANIPDGIQNIDVTVTDINGNTAKDVLHLDIVTHNLPSFGLLDPIFGDNGLLNAVEALTDQTIGGVINNVKVGDTVTINLGSLSYQTTIQAGGVWSYIIPPTDLSKLLDGNTVLSVSVTDHVGNVVTNNVNVGIHIHNLPTVSLDPIFGDGILNVLDLLTGQVISGTVQNAAVGDKISITIGSVSAVAYVGTGGKWSATILPIDLQKLTDGSLTVNVSIEDQAGNTGSTAGSLGVHVSLPTITLDPIFGDGLLSAADALVSQVIGGTIPGVGGAGAHIQVTLGNNKVLNATADANGKFNIRVQPSDLIGLADNLQSVAVKVTDNFGNTNTINGNLDVLVNNLPVIHLGTIFNGDGFLNAAEAVLTQTITGTITNASAGSSVVVKIGANSITAIIDSSGNWSASLTPEILKTLVDGDLTFSVTLTDRVGNTSSVGGGVHIAIHNLPTLTLDPIFGDGVLSIADLLTSQAITGTVTNLTAGSKVDITLGAFSYQASVDAAGKWSLTVPTLDLKTLLDGPLTIDASVKDAAGNGASKQASLSVQINLLPTLTLDPLFGDGLLNLADSLLTQTISGTSTNAIGSVVNVTIGTKTFTATVSANGKWSISLSPGDLTTLTDGHFTVGASITNAAGHSANASAGLDIGIHNLPTVNLDLPNIFGGDFYLNLAESAALQTIDGIATNAIGGSVVVTFNNHTYTSTVGNDGKWSVQLPALDLGLIADGSAHLGVIVTDKVGNTSSNGADINVKIHALPVLTLDLPTINLGNLLSILNGGLQLTGHSQNLQVGAKVNVTVLGQSLTATIGAGGVWGFKIDASLLKGLNLLGLLNIGVEASVQDLAGNGFYLGVKLNGGPLISVASEQETHVDPELMLMAAAETGHTVQDDKQDQNKTEVNTPESLMVSASITSENIAHSTPVSENSVQVNQAITAGVSEGTYTIGGVTIQLADGSYQTGDSVTGSAGDDQIYLNSETFGHINGGLGTDTLVLNGENMHLDLNALGLKIEHVEIFDLGQSGNNSITLGLQQALGVTDKPEDDLIITGAKGGDVTLINADGGVWTSIGQREINGQTFDVYHNSSLSSDNGLGDIFIQQGVHVHMV
ncbi:Ig-like domain-containing protein [Budvicia aquatica]|uniref:Ig-like domain repeat protein n=2 Tax=Budvicia aquatica TaxID=82979 RepID=A0A2C6DQ05_9GAMM|nr:Ig-like domain-containing protein [Budvicia aquatica]PHI30515.1 Ig-like domain repeat protein [Budvicia aquatica]